MSGAPEKSQIKSWLEWAHHAYWIREFIGSLGLGGAAMHWLKQHISPDLRWPVFFLIVAASMYILATLRRIWPAPPDEGLQNNPNLILVADASRDFSADSNPSGLWAYGYYRGGLGGEFLLHREKEQFRGVDIWHSSPVELSLAVMHHRSRNWIEGTAATYLIPPDTICMHPGREGAYVVARWTCQQAGRYRIWYEFRGLDAQTSIADSDIDVRHNWQSLCKDGNVNLNGMGSIISHESEVLDLRVKDTIDFVVGCGQGGFYGADSTGLKAKIYQSKTGN